MQNPFRDRCEVPQSVRLRAIVAVERANEAGARERKE
jgi:hypothetical protein